MLRTSPRAAARRSRRLGPAFSLFAPFKHSWCGKVLSCSVLPLEKLWKCADVQQHVELRPVLFATQMIISNIFQVLWRYSTGKQNDKMIGPAPELGPGPEPPEPPGPPGPRFFFGASPSAGAAGAPLAHASTCSSHCDGPADAPDPSCPTRPSESDSESEADDERRRPRACPFACFGFSSRLSSGSLTRNL